jgi:two-component system nitrate/nitrite sensor histidine kinase NarX
VAVFDCEFRIITPSGKLKWVRACSTPQLLADGRHRSSGMVVDITRRKRAEEALQNANRELRKRVAELSALNQITQTMTLWTELPEALKAVGETLAWLFDRAAIAIWRLDEQRATLTRLVAVMHGQTELGGPTLALVDDAEAMRVVTRASTVVLPAQERGSLLFQRNGSLPASFAGGMVLPLQVRGQVIGLLALQPTASQRAYTPADVALAQTIAGTLANAIENARLFEQAQAAAAEEERRRLARELHDSVSQALFATTLTAETLPKLWEANPTAGRQALEDLRLLTRGAQAEMRTLLVELRPSTLTRAPLSDLLATLVMAAAAKTHATFDAQLTPTPLLPPDVQIALYRIAQEALHNIAKHAQARQISIRLTTAPPLANGASRPWRGSVSLAINDDGCGFDPSRTAAGRLGLGGMRERASGIGARFKLTSRAGEGTQVAVQWRGAASIQEKI